MLLRGTAVVRGLVSRRLRLDDYVARRVRIWGTRTTREGLADLVDVTSLEVLRDER